MVQPWRVTIIARNLTDLVNTSLVENLNPPALTPLTKADWIKPGRSAWQWLANGDPKESEQHEWIDWTSQLGFEYYLIDEGWEKWSDSWQAIASDVAYATTKNVKIWIWTHSRTVWSPEQRKEYFQKAIESGVVGIKIDFPPPASRGVANWYFDTAKDAAYMHLMVDLHGANKPSGMERTWPNAITREGVRGHLVFECPVRCRDHTHVGLHRSRCRRHAEKSSLEAREAVLAASPMAALRFRSERAFHPLPAQISRSVVLLPQ